MVELVKLLGIVIVVFGVFYLLNPDIMKHYVTFWKRGKRLRMGATLAFLIGLVLLLAASECRWGWFVLVFGILSVAKGIWLFLFGQDKIKSMLDWWMKRPVTFMRIHAILVLVLGMLLIYSV